MTALAAPGSVTWTDVLKGGNYDPANDPQANNLGIDLVGGSTYAILQGYRAGAGGADSSTVYYFRGRVDQNPQSVSLYLGFDLTGDGIGDVFVEAQVAGNRALSLHYHLKDSSKAGTSPSNTAWLNSAIDPNIQTDLTSTDSYLTLTDTGLDLDANGKNDYWITFGFTLSSLQTFASNALGASIDGSSIKLLYLFTSTSQTSNGDIGGINDKTADLTAAWSSLGLLIDQSLDTVSTTGVVSTGPVTGAIDIATAMDSGSNDTFTSNGLPVLTFTGGAGLTITLKGADGSTLAAGQYSVSYDAGAGEYTVTLLDAKSGSGGASDPFGTYSSGSATGNPASSIDGTYTIVATDGAANTADVGTFVIDTTAPVTGALDITTATDSRANDTLTNNGLPVLTFTGEEGLTVTLKGADGSTLASDQYSVSHDAGAGEYTVTLLDAKSGSGGASDPFGTYSSGSATGNPASSIDGTYTIVATDGAANTADVGTFVIDTTAPVTGALDITTATDSGANDNLTKSGLPVLTFTGEAGLTITLKGPDGSTLDTSQYSVAYASGTYTVTLLDATFGSGGASDPFGTYSSGSATGNPASSIDGTYTIVATDAAANTADVGTFVIDTTAPVTGALDITTATDSGANDTRTSNGNPELTFTGEAGLTITLKGPDGSTLDTSQYSVAYASGTYTVTLLDATFGSGGASDPFGTYSSGSATGNPASSIDGTYTIVATDAAANTADVGTFVIDTTAPVTGAPDIVDPTDSGANDFLTNNARPALMFTGEAGLTITVQGPDGSALAAGQYGVRYASGTYSVALLDAKLASGGATDPFGTYSSGSATGNPASSVDGTYTILAADQAINSKTVGTFVIDTTAPTISVSIDSISNDTGVAGDFITRTASQTISATLSRALSTGEHLWGSIDGGQTWANVTSKAIGTSVSWATTLARSSSIQFRVGDAAYNYSNTSSQAYVIDNAAITTKVGTIKISQDTGVSQTDFITKAVSQTITAKLDKGLAPDEKLFASADGGATWTDVTGGVVLCYYVTWNATLQEGASSIRFYIKDTAGNQSQVFAQNYTLDTHALSNLFINSLSLSNDDGASSTDFITTVKAQTVYATLSSALPAGDHLLGSLDNGVTWTDITSKVSGTAIAWSGANLLPGAGRAVVLKVIDPAGNVDALASNSYTLDTSKPATLATICGTSGNDTLIGTSAPEKIFGGLGNDILTGGAGADQFVFDTAPNAATNKDTITDFVAGTDKLLISQAVFHGLSGAALGPLSADAFWSGPGVTSAHDATDRFVYNTTSGALYYDADGMGGTAAVQIALLGTASHPAIGAGDFVII